MRIIVIPFRFLSSSPLRRNRVGHDTRYKLPGNLGESLNRREYIVSRSEYTGIHPSTNAKEKGGGVRT